MLAREMAFELKAECQKKKSIKMYANLDVSRTVCSCRDILLQGQWGRGGIKMLPGVWFYPLGRTLAITETGKLGGSKWCEGRTSSI